MDRDQAIAEIATLADQAAFRPFFHRAITLLRNPDQLVQGPFGVCGLTSILRTLLCQDDLTKFVDLVKVVFVGGRFNGICASPGVLLDRRRKQFELKREFHTGSDVEQLDPGKELDFILARSLGKLLKITAPEMYASEVEKSREWFANFKADPNHPVVSLFHLDPEYVAELDADDLSGDLGRAIAANSQSAVAGWGFVIDPAHAVLTVEAKGSKWVLRLAGANMPDESDRELDLKLVDGAVQVTYNTYTTFGSYQKQGDIGLDRAGLVAVVTDVVGVKTCQSGDDITEPDLLIDEINAAFTSSTGFVYALVCGAGSWRLAARGLEAFLGKPRADPDGTPASVSHIVVVTGPIIPDQDNEAFVQIPTWTWGKAFVASMPKVHLPQYVRGYVRGTL
jgi:hypothetical protein